MQLRYDVTHITTKRCSSSRGTTKAALRHHHDDAAGLLCSCLPPSHPSPGTLSFHNNNKPTTAVAADIPVINWIKRAIFCLGHPQRERKVLARTYYGHCLLSCVMQAGTLYSFALAHPRGTTHDSTKMATSIAKQQEKDAPSV